MKCIECAAELKVDHKDHRYAEAGLDNVTLVGIEVRTCPNCGGEEFVIPHIEELHKLLAFALASKEGSLTPDEIRFLRKYLGLSGAALSKQTGVRAESESRWENGKKLMEAPSERLLRLMVYNMKPMEYYPIEMLAEVANGEKQVALKVRAKASIGKKWVTESRAT